MLKLKLALVGVLAVIIAVQVVYLIRQIRARHAPPTTAAAGAPGVGPMGVRPGTQVGPAGGPKAGAPGQMPKAAPPAGGMPPAPGGAPGGAPGSMPGMSPEILPYNEILLGFSKLDGATALTAAQKQKAAPVLKAMGEVISSPGGRADLVVGTALQTLRAEQVAYMTAHRTEPPPPDPEAGANMPDPSFVGSAAIRLLTKRAAEPAGPTQAVASPSPLAAGLAVEDVLGGLLKLEAQKNLAVTPQQAGELLKCIKPMVAAREQIDARKKELVEILTPKQRDRLLVIHDELMTKGMEIVSPQDLLSRLQAQMK